MHVAEVCYQKFFPMMPIVNCTFYEVNIVNFHKKYMSCWFIDFGIEYGDCN